VTQSARPRVHGIVVGSVADDVKLAVAASDRIAPESDPAAREPAPVRFPLRIASPAVVDRIPRRTRFRVSFAELSPSLPVPARSVPVPASSAPLNSIIGQTNRENGIMSF
jgi:hypothetical protein